MTGTAHWSFWSACGSSLTTSPAPPKVGITLKESSTYTDFANINTGGITEDGKDGVNEVSYMILDCMDEMKLLQPSSNVQISRKTPRKFLKRACEISRKGLGPACLLQHRGHSIRAYERRQVLGTTPAWAAPPAA